jgi:hypothetical protein
VAGWLTGRLPDGWFLEAPEVVVDRDEILVVGRLAPPEMTGDSPPAELAAAEAGAHRAVPRGDPRAPDAAG